MENYKITLLKGDGIGPEIVDQAVKVLNKAAEKFDFTVTYDEALLGGCAIDATGVPLPQETIDKCKASDSVILGAVGGPKWDNQPGNNRPEAGLLGIRGALGLFANLRPSVIFGPLKSASPIKDEIIGDDMDIMIVRELTGGIYFGQRGREEDAAWDTEKYSVAEVERIARVAFDLAMKRNKKLTSVDIAGLGIANPLATILSVAMMLRYSLSQPEAAQAIETAVAKVLEENRTPDIYEDGMNKVSCEQMGDLVCEAL